MSILPTAPSSQASSVTASRAAQIATSLAHIERLARFHPPIGEQAIAHRLDQLIDAGSTLDAALAALRLSLPTWTVRRLVLDDGDWVCSLSQTPQLPFDFDDTVDGRDRNPVLAILDAMRNVRFAVAIDGEASKARGQANFIDNVS